jgi:uncharacterized coiled-coil protein SlyX
MAFLSISVLSLMCVFLVFVSSSAHKRINKLETKVMLQNRAIDRLERKAGRRQVRAVRIEKLKNH